MAEKQETKINFTEPHKLLLGNAAQEYARILELFLVTNDNANRMVKTVQEQVVKINALNKEIEDLKKGPGKKKK